MLHFGGLATCNSFVVYLAWNAEKLLLGRFWGADALGLYGRAFQLVTLPVQQLNTAVTGVAFPALSRIQHDAKRLARSFLRGFSLLISATIPITITCALFAEEIVRVVLGAKWMEAAPIFRLLAPVAVVFAVANPFSWLVMSTGRIGTGLEYQHGDDAAGDPGDRAGSESRTQRSRPWVLVGYDVAGHSDSGLVQTRHRNHLGGSLGSHQTTVSVRFARRCGGLAREAHARWQGLPPMLYLMVGLGLVLGVYAWVLLIVMRQKHVYMDLLSQVLPRPQPRQEGTVEPAASSL